MSEDVRTLIELYLRGDATSSQQCALYDALERDDALMEDLFQEALFEGDIRQHFQLQNTETLMRRCVAAVGKPVTRSYRKRIKSQQRKRFYQQIVPLAAAALILVSLSVFLMLESARSDPANQPLIHIHSTLGPATYKITRDGLHRLKDGDPIFSGERVMIEDSSRAQFTYADGSMLYCEPGTLLEFFKVNDTKLIQVDGGHVHAEVEPQSSGALILRSQHAEVRVVGTSFDFRVHDNGSDLDVHEGSVQFTNKLGDAINVIAGQSAAINNQAELKRVKRPQDYDAPSEWSITANDVEAGAWQAELVEGSTSGRPAFRSVVRQRNEHHGIVSGDYWFKPPFRVHEDSHIRMRVMTEQPGFWHMFLLVQKDVGRTPTANIELQPKMPEGYRHGEWVTLEFPVKAVQKLDEDGKPRVNLKQLDGSFCFRFFFDSQENDVGLNIESFEIFVPKKHHKHRH